MKQDSIPKTRSSSWFAREPAIPRTIHQTFRHNRLPNDIRQNVALLKALNPGWDYKFYDDAGIERFINKEYGPRISTYYRRIDEHYGGARADLFRYLLMYRCGGVYLDIKSSAIRPLCDVIHVNDSYILSQWPNGMGEPYYRWGIHPELNCIDGGEFQQWNIISVPGHPFLRAVIECVFANIDNYDPMVHGTGMSAALRICGPIAYTLAILPLLSFHPYRKVRRHTEIGLKYSIFERDSRTIHRRVLGTSCLYERRPLIRMDTGNCTSKLSDGDHTFLRLPRKVV